MTLRTTLTLALALAFAFGPLSVLGQQHRHGSAPPAEIPSSWAARDWFPQGPYTKAYDLRSKTFRVTFPVSTQRKETQTQVEQGLAFLAAGWRAEAIRSLRHALYTDPTCPMAYWAMALAHLDSPETARSFFEELPPSKVTKRENAYLDALRTHLFPAKGEKPSWESLAKAFGDLHATNPKELEALTAAIWVYRSHSKELRRTHRDQIQGWLSVILTQSPTHPISAFALEDARWHSLVSPQTVDTMPFPIALSTARRHARANEPREALVAYGRMIQAYSQHATIVRAMPSQSPQFLHAVQEVGLLLARHAAWPEVQILHDYLDGMPRHPVGNLLNQAKAELAKALASKATRVSKLKKEFGDLSWLHALPRSGWIGLSWDLPSVDNSVISSQDFINRDLLLIFYLGKGCIHGMEQLQAFSLKVEEYRKADIEIVAVSLDSVDGLKDTLTQADASVPVTIVSDESLAIFKAYNAYDEFDQTTIHGTYFVSKSGIVQWADSGPDPFMDTEWLLTECRRLQALDTTLPALDY